ncbi:MAG: DUF2085 domain-containing protein [Myxococcales bacterium]|nr:DUF2085 domain-containing protein [Myxococcales bacterium]
MAEPDLSEPTPTVRRYKALYWSVRVALLVIGFSPLWVWAISDIPALSWLGAPFDAWFSYQCHREPERSFEILGRFLPVCNRCLGIYLGLGLGALFMRPRLSVWPLRLWVGFAAAAMILDVWTEALGMRPPSSAMRLVTGILLDYPVAVAVAWTEKEAGQSEDTPPD